MLRSDPTRPRVSFYDDQLGERIELSTKVLANWIAKAANWLQDECAAEAGTTVRLDLPPTHWRTIYWALAVWSVGATVSDEDQTDVLVSMSEGDLIEPTRSLAPSELASQPDYFTAYAPPQDNLPALQCGGDTVSYAELIRSTNASAPRTIVDGPLIDVISTAANIFAANGSLLLFCHENTSLRTARSREEGL